MMMPNGWCCPWCHVLCEVCGGPFEKNGTDGVIKHRHRSAIYEQYRKWDGNGSIPNEDSYSSRVLNSDSGDFRN